MQQLKKVILFFSFFMVIVAAQSQNRYYDYKDRNPEGKVHILYMGGGSYHDYLSVAEVLRKFLEVRHEYHITYSEDYSVFTRPLDKYDVILLAGMPKKLEKEELTGFLTAVKEGKSVIGLHAATAALSKDKQRIEYTKVIGAQFAGHPPIYRFPVEIKEDNHPITKNIGPFDIYDEMYFFKNMQEGTTVLLEAEHEERGRTAIAWVREYGKGKIFYTTFGHAAQSAGNRYFQQLLLNALEWMTEDVKKSK